MEIEFPTAKVQKAAENAINEVIEKWAAELKESKGIKVNHEGAMLQLTQRPEYHYGYNIKIYWPFTVDFYGMY